MKFKIVNKARFITSMSLLILLAVTILADIQLQILSK